MKRGLIALFVFALVIVSIIAVSAFTDVAGNYIEDPSFGGSMSKERAAEIMNTPLTGTTGETAEEARCRAGSFFDKNLCNQTALGTTDSTKDTADQKPEEKPACSNPCANGVCCAEGQICYGGEKCTTQGGVVDMNLVSGFKSKVSNAVKAVGAGLSKAFAAFRGLFS